MPSASRLTPTSDFSLVQEGEVLVDSSLRKVVNVGAVGAGLSLGASLQDWNDADSVTFTFTQAASGTGTVMAALGSTAKIRVLGFSICNENTDTMVRFEMRFNTDAFWLGSVCEKGSYNWNFVNHSALSGLNEPIIVWGNAAVTATITVFYVQE